MKTQSVRITLSKKQILSQKGGFLGPIISFLTKTVVPKILPVLGTLGLASASGARYGATQKATSGSGAKKRVANKPELAIVMPKQHVNDLLNSMDIFE